MAKKTYAPGAAGEILIERDPQVVLVADITAMLPSLQEIRADSDATRAYLATVGIPGLGVPAFIAGPDPNDPNIVLSELEQFDVFLDDKIARVQDERDYENYETGTDGKTIFTGDWYLPEALVNPLPNDNGTDVVANAIDAQGGGVPDPNDPLNTTYWQSSVAGTRELIVRIRGYTKRCEGIRLRTNSGDARAQLQNLEVRAANSLGNIDEPGNVVATGVNVDDANAWYDIDFIKAKCVFLKFIITISNHTNPDVIRMRSLQARVGITNHEK